MTSSASSTSLIDVQILTNEINKIRGTVRELTFQLSHYNTIMSELENELRRVCDHDWVVDDTVFDMYDREYRCTKCNLYK